LSFDVTFSGLRIAKKDITCSLAHGVSISCGALGSYARLTHNPGLKAFGISDEDIKQTLPGTLEAFEAGVSC
jgi:hypothetical protein